MISLVLSGGVAGWDIYDPPMYTMAQEPWGAEIWFGAEYSGIFAKGIVRVDMWRTDTEGFFPNQLTSIFNAGFRYKVFEIGVRYSCFHPVTPYISLMRKLDYEFAPRWDGAYTEAYIKYGKD